MNYDEELTLLTEDQVNESEIFKKYGTRAVSEFAIENGIKEDYSLNKQKKIGQK